MELASLGSTAVRVGINAHVTLAIRLRRIGRSTYRSKANHKTRDRAWR